MIQVFFKLLPLYWDSEQEFVHKPFKNTASVPTALQLLRYKPHWFSKPRVHLPNEGPPGLGSLTWALDPSFLRGTSAVVISLLLGHHTMGMGSK